MNTSAVYGKTRYLTLGAGVLSLLVLGLIYGWSLFKAPLKELFPVWTETQLSIAFVILMCTYAAGGMAAGALSKLQKPKIVFMLAAVCTLVGFIGASFMKTDAPSASLIQLYLTYCLISGFGTGLGYNLCTTLIVRHFPDKVGMVIGILLMGFGLGAFVIGGAATALISTYGLFKAFRIIGIGSFILFLLCMFFIREPKEDQVVLENRETGEQEGSTLKEAMRTPEFWLINLWAVFASAVCMIVIGNAASIILYYGAPGIIGMVISITNGVARVVNGTLMDKLSYKKMSAIHAAVLILSGILMLAGSLLSSVPILVCGLLVTGLAFGGTPTSAAFYLRKRFGEKHYPEIYSTTGPGLLLATVLGTMLSGILQDKADPNTVYLTSFLLMLGYGIISLLLVLPVRKKSWF